MLADLISNLIEDWTAECPDIDPSAMDVVGRVMRLGDQFERDASAALKKRGLRYTDFDILATLRRGGSPYELTPGALANAVLLTSGAMTAALDRLERGGHITRHFDKRDRRVRTARLTKSGERIALEAAKERFEVARRNLEGLSPADRAKLVLLLKQLEKNTIPWLSVNQPPGQ